MSMHVWFALLYGIVHVLSLNNFQTHVHGYWNIDLWTGKSAYLSTWWSRWAPCKLILLLHYFFCACVKIFNINSVELDLSKRMHSQCASIMLYNHPQGVIFVCPCRPRLEDQPTTSPLAESPAQHGFVSFQDTGVLSADWRWSQIELWVAWLPRSVGWPNPKALLRTSWSSALQVFPVRL